MRVSVIIVNYNGGAYIRPCLTSLFNQTIAHDMEIIVVDNESQDDSVQMARWLLATYPNGKVLNSDANIGFAAGVNYGVRKATGDYVFITNPDTRFSPNCMYELWNFAEVANIPIVSPTILDYDTGVFQTCGTAGFDFTGNYIAAKPGTEKLFAATDLCLIRRDVFNALGGYDPTFFMYGEGHDFCWRARVAGYDVAYWGGKMWHKGCGSYSKTTPEKRYLANRNHLTTILKNADWVLLVLALFAVVQIMAESIIASLAYHQWAFMRRGCIDAIRDVWARRGATWEARSGIARARVRSDWEMLAWFRVGWSRWGDYKRVLKNSCRKVLTIFPGHEKVVAS